MCISHRFDGAVIFLMQKELGRRGWDCREKLVSDIWQPGEICFLVSKAKAANGSNMDSFSHFLSSLYHYIVDKVSQSGLR